MPNMIVDASELYPISPCSARATSLGLVAVPGKIVKFCRAFSDTPAVVRDARRLCGEIDTKGVVTISKHQMYPER